MSGGSELNVKFLKAILFPEKSIIDLSSLDVALIVILKVAYASVYNSYHSGKSKSNKKLFARVSTIAELLHHQEAEWRRNFFKKVFDARDENSRSNIEGLISTMRPVERARPTARRNELHEALGGDMDIMLQRFGEALQELDPASAGVESDTLDLLNEENFVSDLLDAGDNFDMHVLYALVYGFMAYNTSEDGVLREYEVVSLKGSSQKGEESSSVMERLAKLERELAAEKVRRKVAEKTARKLQDDLSTLAGSETRSHRSGKPQATVKIARSATEQLQQLKADKERISRRGSERQGRAGTSEREELREPTSGKERSGISRFKQVIEADVSMSDDDASHKSGGSDTDSDLTASDHSDIEDEEEEEEDDLRLPSGYTSGHRGVDLRISKTHSGRMAKVEAKVQRMLVKAKRDFRPGEMVSQLAISNAIRSESGLYLFEPVGSIHEVRQVKDKNSKEVKLKIAVAAGIPGERDPALCGIDQQCYNLFMRSPDYLEHFFKDIFRLLNRKRDDLHVEGHDTKEIVLKYKVMEDYRICLRQLVRAVMGANASEHPRCIELWAVINQFHLFVFNTAIIHEDWSLFDRHTMIQFWQSRYQHLVAEGSQQMELAMESLGYCCPEPGCGLPGRAEGLCERCGMGTTKVSGEREGRYSGTNSERKKSFDAYLKACKTGSTKPMKRDEYLAKEFPPKAGGTGGSKMPTTRAAFFDWLRHHQGKVVTPAPVEEEA